MAMLSEFKEAFDNRYQAIETEKAQGKKAIGWVCTYVPEEILYAADMEPVRIFGTEGETPLADAHMYSNLCTFVRSALQMGLEGKYSFLDGYVTCNTCDHIRRLFDVWSRYINTSFIHIISLPHKITEASLKYFQSELVRLKEELEKTTGKKITDDSLKHAIEVYNQSRILLQKLDDLRKREAPPISGAEALDVALAGMVIPKDRYNKMLKKLLQDLEGREGIDGNRLRIMVGGSELDHSEYIKVIEDLGAIVVAEDLCCGSRYIGDLVEIDGNPIEALAKRYLTKAQCPRMRPPTERHARIREIIKAYKVDGVIYQIIKFCNLIGEDYPILRNAIKDLDIPILVLNREYSLAGLGQMKTRIQAFFESLQG
jgi:benzoyl-CoA reductase subunit C